MFEGYESKVAEIQEARLILSDIRSLYRDAKQMQTKLAVYQAGTSPAFNAAVETVYTLTERQELGRMLVDVNALVTDWETNHREALGLPPT